MFKKHDRTSDKIAGTNLEIKRFVSEQNLDIGCVETENLDYDGDFDRKKIHERRDAEFEEEFLPIAKKVRLVHNECDDNLKTEDLQLEDKKIQHSTMYRRS